MQCVELGVKVSSIDFVSSLPGEMRVVGVGEPIFMKQAGEAYEVTGL